MAPLKRSAASGGPRRSTRPDSARCHGERSAPRGRGSLRWRRTIVRQPGGGPSGREGDGEGKAAPASAISARKGHARHDRMTLPGVNQRGGAPGLGKWRGPPAPPRPKPISARRAGAVRAPLKPAHARRRSTRRRRHRAGKANSYGATASTERARSEAHAAASRAPPAVFVQRGGETPPRARAALAEERSHAAGRRPRPHIPRSLLPFLVDE